METSFARDAGRAWAARAEATRALNTLVGLLEEYGRLNAVGAEVEADGVYQQALGAYAYYEWCQEMETQWWDWVIWRNLWEHSGSRGRSL